MTGWESDNPFCWVKVKWKEITFLIQFQLKQTATW